MKEFLLKRVQADVDGREQVDLNRPDVVELVPELILRCYDVWVGMRARHSRSHRPPADCRANCDEYKCITLQQNMFTWDKYTRKCVSDYVIENQTQPGIMSVCVC
jgi:hypothetical protein